MITKKNTWVRVAGNAKNIRAGGRHGWRCFLGNASGVNPKNEIPLTHWSFVGTATNQNAIPGINSKGTAQQETILAWVDLYGDFVVNENDVLLVVLRDPNAPKSQSVSRRRSR